MIQTQFLKLNSAVLSVGAMAGVWLISALFVISMALGALLVAGKILFLSLAEWTRRREVRMEGRFDGRGPRMSRPIVMLEGNGETFRLGRRVARHLVDGRGRPDHARTSGCGKTTLLRPAPRSIWLLRAS